MFAIMYQMHLSGAMRTLRLHALPVLFIDKRKPWPACCVGALLMPLVVTMLFSYVRLFSLSYSWALEASYSLRCSMPFAISISYLRHPMVICRCSCHI